MARLASVMLTLFILASPLSACENDDTSKTPAADIVASEIAEDAGGQPLADVTPDVDNDTAGDVGSDAGELAGYLAIEPPAPGELKVISPGEDTICSRGTPYRFFVIGGASDKVVVDFQGGGACWNSLTCSISDAIFSAEAPSEEDVRGAFDAGLLDGIYRLDDPTNPFYGWTLVHIPYCTGDVHWGTATHDYGNDLVIHHRGFVNAMAVRAWIEAQFPVLERVFVTGCSAGAYGAIGSAPYIAQSYPDAHISVLADSGAGVITDDFFQNSFPNWGAEEAIPTWLDGLAGRDIYQLSIVDLYIAVANGHPTMRVAQHNTAFDDDQTFYYLAMGGDQSLWSSTMFQQLADIETAAPAFRYYVAPGPVHCIHPYSFYFSREVNGTAYTDWLHQLSQGETPPDSVACEGDACLSDPVCDACADGSLDSSACRWCDGWPP